MAGSAEDSAFSKRAWLWPVLVAAVIRIPIACIADDQWGDAPIRFDLVNRWVQHPGIWWSFDQTYQYGPLPTHLAGVLALTGLGPWAATRTLVVVAGIVGVGLLAVLATRFGGPRAGLAAGLALALSPLHIQASTTFTSEAIYVAFLLACLLRAFERDAFGMALFAFGAATTRYDTWLWIPLLSAWWLWREWPRQGWRALIGPTLLGVGPATILIANGVALGKPFTPLNYITKDHITLAAEAQARVGTGLWRSLMTIYWPGAFIAVLTPGFALVAFWSLGKQIRERSQALLPATLGAFPPVLYTIKSVVFGTFWPMARFALGPAVLVSTGMKDISRRTLIVCVVVAIGYNVTLFALGDGQPGIGLTAAAASPISLLPADLRAGSRCLAEVKDEARGGTGAVAVDLSPHYDDIFIFQGARMMDFRYQLLNPPAGSVPRRIIGLMDGKLSGTLDATAHAFGHAYKRVVTQGRVSCWDLAE